MIIRADKAFFEAMEEAGYTIDLPSLRRIYEAAKKKRARNRPSGELLPMFPELGTGKVG